MPATQREKSVSELLGVPPPPRNGKGRLVAAAIELFYSRGFHAVGLDQIIDAAGVTKTTFYKHFESKEELMVEAVRVRDDWEMQAWGRAVRKVAGDDPRGQLLAFFDVMDVWFNDPSFRGCMFLNTAAEFPNANDPIHEAASLHKRRTRDVFRDLAAKAGVDDAEGFADQFTAMVEGTLVLRQAHGRNDAARVIRPAVEKLLDASLDASKAASSPPKRGRKVRSV